MRNHLIKLADQLDTMGQTVTANKIDNLIKLAETCPECGGQNAYYSIDGVECANRHCKYFNELHAMESMLGVNTPDMPTAQDMLVD